MADLEASATLRAGHTSPSHGVLAPASDPVLRALESAQDQYLEVVGNLADQVAETQADAARLEGKNRGLREECVRAEQQARRVPQLEEEIRRLGQEGAEQGAQLRHQIQRSERDRERARLLADTLKGIHRAVLSSDVFSLILRGCLQITGASRGLYLTVRDGRAPQVRAAVGVDGYPGRSPSAFLTALCQRALEQAETPVWNNGRIPEGLPAPDEAEHFHNGIAALVALLKRLNGVVIIADKLHGDFDADDAEVVLSVGDQAAVAIENQHLQGELHRAYM